MAELFTVNEAAAIAEISPETIRTALEKKFVTPSRKMATGKSVRHGFSADDVLLLKVLSEFPFSLSRRDKSSLTDILVHGSREAANWSLRGSTLLHRSEGLQLRVDYKQLQQKVSSNLAAFRWGKRRVTSDPRILGGEPVFRGTRIPLQHIASLFRKNVPETEIAEDFPALSTRDLAFARLVSRLGDKPGRPRKPLIIERAHRAA